MFQVFCSICCRKPWRNILGVSRSIVWGSWGGRGADNRWSPEVSHLLEFSFMEINKTALNKSRTCKFEKKEKKKKRRDPGKSIGERKREREITDDESGFSLSSEKKRRNWQDWGTENDQCWWVRLLCLTKKTKTKKKPQILHRPQMVYSRMIHTKVIIKDEYIFKKVILRFEQKKYLFWLHLRKFKFGTRSWT